MKKVLTIVIVLFISVSMFTGCVFVAEKINEGEEDNDITDNPNELEFSEIRDITQLPQKAQDVINKLKEQRGFAYLSKNDITILFISSGEKTTGGYSIKVKSVEKIDGVTKVTVEEKSPGRDDIVTMALTYPYTIVKITGGTGEFKVVNEKGEEFKMIELNS